MDVLNDLPAAIEWRVYKGDTATFTMFVTDEKNDPIDLSTYTVTGNIRQNPSDNAAAQSLAIVTNDNIINIQIPDTTILDKVSYFDIQTVVNGVTKTILYGRILADTDVTR